MTARTNRASRLRRRYAPRFRKGSATVELALLAPILVVLVLWGNYFWELQRVRLKAAEVSRYVAFERTVRPDPQGIAAEARERYKDLDGSTPTGELGTAFRNRLTLHVQAEDAPAPLSPSSMGSRGGGGIATLAGAAMGALGGTAESVAGMMGLDTSVGAVRTNVSISIENAIIPEQIALYTTGFTDGSLDLSFNDTFYLYHDTWRAWPRGVNPADKAEAYAAVEAMTHERVRGIAYAGLTSGSAGSSLNSIGDFLQVLGLDFPFSPNYVRDSVLILPVDEHGRHMAATETRTVPGDALQAAYWQNDDDYCFGNCEPTLIQQKRGLTSRSDYNDNWPMRSYNCRGPYFQGAIKSEAPESLYSDQYVNHDRKSYHHYGGGNSCAD